MTLGTASTFVAISSGEAAGELAENVPHAKAVLDEHQELAEITAGMFLALTLIFASIVFVPSCCNSSRAARSRRFYRWSF